MQQDIATDLPYNPLALSQLSSLHLQDWCTENSEIARNFAFWECLLAVAHPSVYSILQGVTFPDYEVKSRQNRDFLPFREVYTELQRVREHPADRILADPALNGKLLPSDLGLDYTKFIKQLLEKKTKKAKEAVQRVKEFSERYPMLSFAMANTSALWRLILVEVDERAKACLPELPLGYWDMVLVESIESGVAEALERMLKRKDAVKSKIFQYAARHGRNELLHVLICRNAIPETERTVMVRAAVEGNQRDVLQLLYNAWSFPVGEEYFEVAVHSRAYDCLLFLVHITSNKDNFFQAVLELAKQMKENSEGKSAEGDEPPEHSVEQDSEGNSEGDSQQNAEMIKLILLNSDLPFSEATAFAIRHSAPRLLESYLAIPEMRADIASAQLEAVIMDSPEVLQMLLSHGDPSTGESELLRAAAYLACTEIVQLLLADGRSDPTARDSIVLCCRDAWKVPETRADEIVKLQTPKIRQRPQQQREIVALLLADGRADPSADKSRVLRQAVESRDKELVEMLLRDGRANPADENSEVLRIAARMKDKIMLEILLRDGRADPCADDSAVLREAVKERYRDGVELLLSDGRADPAAGRSGALQAALNNKDFVLIHAFLEDKRANPGDCPELLNFCVDINDTDLLSTILSDERTIPDALDGKALRTAARNKNNEIIKMFLADSRVTLTNDALTASLEIGNDDAVRLLLADGRADPSANDDRALIIAVEEENLEMVKLLLADPRVRADARNGRALRCAKNLGCDEILELLTASVESRGAQNASTALPTVVPVEDDGGESGDNAPAAGSTSALELVDEAMVRAGIPDAILKRGTVSPPGDAK